MKRVCEWCSKPFEAQRPTRKTCSERCRARRSARKRQMTKNGETGDAVAPVFPVPDPSPGEPSPLVVATEQALEKAGKLNTPVGMLTMVIASRMGQDSTLETGGGIVALSKELDRLLAIALQGSEPPDELDELEERRRRKAARAGN